MKKFLKILGLIVLAIILFVLISGLFVDKDYHIEKEITINAPREKVWSHVSSFSEMAKWNPFTEKDPNIKTSVSGTDGTVGAVYHWDGNKDVGAGEQTITKLDPNNRVETHLHFIKPFEGEADAFLNLSDTASGTKVTWGFDTHYKYPMNVMLLFIDMDEMMGKEYNKGLANLKAIAER